MSGNADDPLLSVAGKISSGVPVDWKELAGSDRHTRSGGCRRGAPLTSALRSRQRNGSRVLGPLSDHRADRCRHVRCGLSRDRSDSADRSRAQGHAASSARAAPIEQEKALDEASRLVRVKHPNVVRVFGAERVGDEIGLVDGVRARPDTRRDRQAAGAVQRERGARSSASISVARWQPCTARSPSRRHQSAQRDARGRWPDRLDGLRYRAAT